MAFNLAKSVCLPADMEHHKNLTELKAIRSATKSMILVSQFGCPLGRARSVGSLRLRARWKAWWRKNGLIFVHKALLDLASPGTLVCPR